jgi:phosphonate utilization associated putative membrane protein
MTPVLAIGISVLLHVSWNLLTRRTSSDANFLWWIVGLYVLVFAPFTLPDFIRSAEQSPVLYLCAAISGTTNGLYFLALRNAYHQAPASAVYPMVRSSPIFIALIEVLIFDRSFPLISWCAISVSAFGLWMIATSSHDGVSRLNRAWPYALFAALMTVVYSLSDKVATSNMQGINSALGYVCVNYAISWGFLCFEQLRRTGKWIPTTMPTVLSLAIGTFGIGTAYALVIHAMRWLPAAYAVTLTNAGIVLTVLLGVVWLKEYEGWQKRVSGSVLIVIGLIIIGVNS